METMKIKCENSVQGKVQGGMLFPSRERTVTLVYLSSVWYSLSVRQPLKKRLVEKLCRIQYVPLKPAKCALQRVFTGHANKGEMCFQTHASKLCSICTTFQNRFQGILFSEESENISLFPIHLLLGNTKKSGHEGTMHSYEREKKKDCVLQTKAINFLCNWKLLCGRDRGWLTPGTFKKDCFLSTRSTAYCKILLLWSQKLCFSITLACKCTPKTFRNQWVNKRNRCEWALP